MNITTIRDNLKNTIRGKEALLAVVEAPMPGATSVVNQVINDFLVINLKELRTILSDVEQLCEEKT